MLFSNTVESVSIPVGGCVGLLKIIPKYVMATCKKQKRTELEN
jgi:hypothetical protein